MLYAEQPENMGGNNFIYFSLPEVWCHSTLAVEEMRKEREKRSWVENCGQNFFSEAKLFFGVVAILAARMLGSMEIAPLKISLPAALYDMDASSF